MNTSWSRLGQFGPAIRIVVALTVLLGLAYPLAVTGIAQTVFPGQANGSLIERHGTTIGSSLIGQSFSTPADAGTAYFQSRPSAAGDGYDALASGASNLGLDNPVLVREVEKRRAAIAEQDGVPASAVPADAVMASGSGLDPQISPAYAEEQVARIARVRRLPAAEVRRLVASHTQGRVLGFLGEPRVNVLELNLALDALGSAR